MVNDDAHTINCAIGVSPWFGACIEFGIAAQEMCHYEVLINNSETCNSACPIHWLYGHSSRLVLTPEGRNARTYQRFKNPDPRKVIIAHACMCRSANAQQKLKRQDDHDVSALCGRSQFTASDTTPKLHLGQSSFSMIQRCWLCREHSAKLPSNIQIVRSARTLDQDPSWGSPWASQNYCTWHSYVFWRLYLHNR